MRHAAALLPKRRCCHPRSNGTWGVPTHKSKISNPKSAIHTGTGAESQPELRPTPYALARHRLALASPSLYRTTMTDTGGAESVSKRRVEYSVDVAFEAPTRT